MEYKHIQKCSGAVLYLLIVSLRPKLAKLETETFQDPLLLHVFVRDIFMDKIVSKLQNNKNYISD